MTIANYRLKLTRVNNLKLRVSTRIPAQFEDGVGISITKTNGVYTVNLDYSLLAGGPILDATTAYVAVEDQSAGIYKTVSLSSLLTSSLDADLQAIAALTGTGILARTADGTWALRSIAGTANEITLTNGDGVSGNPTVSLPAAMTFTGKTVTGGTFTGATISAAASFGIRSSGAAFDLKLASTEVFSATRTLTWNLGDADRTIILGGGNLNFAAAFQTVGAFPLVLTATASTNVTFPTTGTLATLAGAEALTNKTYNGNTWTAGTGVLTIAAGKTLTASNTLTFTGTDSSSVAFGTGGTVVYTSGFGANVATFLATPSSANLRAALTDEVGTGAAYFVGGALGTPASATLTNATGLPLSGLVAQAAFTFVGNNTSGSAVPTAVDIAALTTKASPAASDYVMLSDQAASGAWKKATVSSVASAGSVSSIAGNTGAFTLGSGLTNSTNDLQVAAGVPLQIAQTVDVTNRSTTSLSFVDSSVAAPAITPASTSNKVLITVSGIMGASSSSAGFLELRRGTTSLTPAGVNEFIGLVITDGNYTESFSISFLDSPATTSATTYRLYFKSGAGATIYLGRRGADTLFDSPTIITVQEIKG